MKPLSLSFFMLNLLVFSADAFAENPSFQKCGVYEVTGLLDCQHKDCLLTAYPGSKSEVKITFHDVSPLITRLKSATIRAKLQITQNKKEPISGFFLKDEIPFRSRPNSSLSAVHFIREEKCNP